MDCDDAFPRLPTSVTKFDLHGVTMPVKTLLALLNFLENLPHAVTCELEKCKIKPSSEYGQIENRLETSTNLHFNGYSIVTDMWRNEQMCFKCWK